MLTHLVFPANIKSFFVQIYKAFISPIQKRYFVGIAMQTDHNYRHSKRFTERYEVVGLERALSMYFDNPHECMYLFNETRKGSIIIRLVHTSQTQYPTATHAHIH